MLRRPALLALIAIWSASALAAPRDGGAPVTDPRTLEAAAVSAMAGDAEARQVVQDFLLGGGGPKGVSERARQLIDTLSARPGLVGNPAELQQAMSLVTEAAEDSITAAPVARLVVGRDLQLSARARGYDFGSPDSEVMQGFEKVTAKDPRVTGSDVRALRRPTGGRLQADGVADIHRFETEVPNGTYRVVLLTDDLGSGLRTQTPFGARVDVNGNPVPMASMSPDNWINQATLGDGVQAAGPGRGGMVVVEAEVADGKLVLDFGAGRTYLTGVIVEPVDDESALELDDESAAHYESTAEDRAAAQDAVMTAAAERLADVTTAAGPGQAAAIADVTGPALEPPAQISPN